MNVSIKKLSVLATTMLVVGSTYAANPQEWCRSLLRSISIYDRLITAARKDNDMETVLDLEKRIMTINGVIETERERKKKDAK